MRLALKRAAFAPVGAAVRAAAWFYRLAARVGASAASHGLDIRRAWDVPARPMPPHVERWSAADFLLLARAGRDRQATALTPERPVSTSVIIPVFNEVEFTFQCLRSLLRAVNLNDTELVVINRGSTDETGEVLSHFGGLLRVSDTEAGAGRLEACNRGAAAARGRYLVFLDNQTIVLPGWLENLVGTAEENPRAGAIGSMRLYADGRVREAGSVVWKTGEDFHYGRGASPEDARLSFAREVDYCSVASLLIRRELFDALGGFDPRYSPSHYGDVDLCFGVRSLGSEVIYQPLSRLVDQEGAASDTDAGSERLRAANRAKFYEKWREALEREHLPADLSRAERAANRKAATQVIIFDDHVPTPDRDAGSARMAFILKSLSEWCHPVFVSTSKQSLPDYERLLRRQGVETAGLLEAPRLLKERRFAAAILSRPPVAEALLKTVRRADPRVKIIFDTVDVHFVRLAREHALTGDARAAREAERYRRVETRLARASDVVWCASDADQQAIAREAPGVPTLVIPTIHRPHGRGLPFEEREHLLFVGNFVHRPNVDAVRFFVSEILPAVRESVPGVRLLLVGDNAPPEVAALAGDEAGVRLLGYVPDIDPVFASSRVFVAPIRFGAGMKGKIGEALAYGLPLVTTAVGAEGIGLRDGENAFIADGPREFAERVVRLYGDAALWQRLSDNGYRHVEERFSPRVIGRIVNDSIRALIGRRQD